MERGRGAVEPVEEMRRAVDEVEPVAMLVPTEALAPQQLEVANACDLSHARAARTEGAATRPRCRRCGARLHVLLAAPVKPATAESRRFRPRRHATRLLPTPVPQR